MKKKVIVLLTAFLFLFGCSSTTIIKSSPPGAKLYLDGNYKGVTPCTHSDKALMGMSKIVLMKKEGYKGFTGIIKKEEAQLGPIIAGFFIIVPWLWALGYPDEYTFEMETL